MADLPVLDLEGDARERGRVHGEAMAAQIRDNLETYLRRFEAGGLGRDRVAEEGALWVDAIAGHNPEYADEMRGIAEGADMALTDIATLNARYETAYGVFKDEGGSAEAPEPDGCTSFGLLPEATRSGHCIIGQNWDWLAGIRGRAVILRVRRDDKPDFVGFTEAGIVGCKIGVNEAGIGLVVNGLVSKDDGKLKFMKPFHVRCAEVLDAWTMDKALLPIIESDRVGSTNILIGHAEGEVIDIEASPFAANYLYPEGGLVTHANHFVHPRSVASEFERVTPGTLYRGPRLDRLLRRHLGRLDTDTIAAALRDHFSHPASICRHPDPELPEAKKGMTVTSAIIDLEERTLAATDGPPCDNDYQLFALEPSAAAAAPETIAV